MMKFSEFCHFDFYLDLTMTADQSRNQKTKKKQEGTRAIAIKARSGCVQLLEPSPDIIDDKNNTPTN